MPKEDTEARGLRRQLGDDAHQPACGIKVLLLVLRRILLAHYAGWVNQFVCHQSQAKRSFNDQSVSVEPRLLKKCQRTLSSESWGK